MGLPKSPFGGGSSFYGPATGPVIKYRPGYPERPANSGLFEGTIQANAIVEGTWGAEIHESVTPQDGEPVVARRGVSAFYGSDLAALLATGGIDTTLPFLSTISNLDEVIAALA